MELKLGWSQSYNGLEYHLQEAYNEKNINKKTSKNPPYAIFSNKYYNSIDELTKKYEEKKYDYCFIGSINSCLKKRLWILEFVKKYFTINSIFINTDIDNNNNKWKSLGIFDLSDKNLGYCPKKQKNNQSKDVQYRIVSDNLFYFQTMCDSKFVLCPAGDSEWSFRFYEVMMCKSIPIVETYHNTYRTKEEAEINYKYILSTDIDNINNINNNNNIYNEYVDNNTQIFIEYHMITYNK
jgi:hypothetical protein